MNVVNRIYVSNGESDDDERVVVGHRTAPFRFDLDDQLAVAGLYGGAQVMIVAEECARSSSAADAR